MDENATQKFDADAIADCLLRLYDQEFGGSRRGRFRISMKLMKKIAGRGRLHSTQLRAVADEVFERGLVLVDLETFFVVLSQRTFVNYRRVNEASLGRSLRRHAAEQAQADH
ncbi:MAG: hypothetical protein OEQ29_02390 [Alphaproteobacteria bacterium]|nr:hypothetical protein [Alphaproteobacteria bacterium]